MNRSLSLVVAILFIAVGTLYGQEAPSPKAKGALVLTYLKRPVLPTTEDNPMQQSADEVYLLFIVGNQAAATLQRDAVVRDSVLYPGGSDACMIDLATGNYTRRDESTILGGPYLITGNRKYKWDLTDETKVIGGIECSRVRPTDREKPVLWIADDLPVTAGPIGLTGLPGAVVSMRWGDHTYSFIKVTTDPGIRDIAFTKEGKSCTEEEYEKIVDDVLGPLLENGGSMEVGGGTIRIVR